MRDLPSGFAGSTSIKPTATGAVQSQQATDDTDQPRPETPFSPDDLEIHWSEFAESLRNDSPHLYSTLKGARPEILPGWTLQLPIENKVLDEELNTRKTDLLEFLRGRLNNYRISLQTKVAENVATARPYTDKEKFERMMDKNPEVAKLREELDLEIEY